MPVSTCVSCRTTKFFACLDLKESQELYEASQLVSRVVAKSVAVLCMLLFTVAYAPALRLWNVDNMSANVALEPHETLFETGDSSEGGIYIVVEGALGVFLAGADGGPRHTNSLHPGESVGDLDVLDGGALLCAVVV